MTDSTGTQITSASTCWIHRPLLGVIVCFSLGTVVGLQTAFPAALVLMIAGVSFFFSAAFLCWRVSTLALWGTVFFTGWANAALSVQAVSGRELRNLMARPQEHIEVVGIVSYDPVLRAGWREGEEVREFVCRLEAVRREGSWQRSRGEIAARWKANRNTRAVRYGERWLLSGLVTVVEPRSLQMNRPRYHMNVDLSSTRFLSGGHGTALISWCLRGRRACFDILGRGLEDFPEQAGLLRALILGYRENLSDELYRSFSLTGTLHVVAISGVHVAILALLFMAVLKTLGFSRPHWVLLLAPTLVLYTIATGMSASAVRACVMAIVFWSAPLFSRKSDGPSALATAALLILAFVPTQLFDMGFLLSFMAVVGLITLYPMWMPAVHAVLATDPWCIRPLKFWKQWRRWWAIEIASLIVASIAVWLYTTPLSAFAFNVISPVGLMGNLLVIPLSSLVLLTGVLSLAAGSLSMFLVEIFNHANRVFISILIAWVNWIAKIPGGHEFVPSPSALWMIAWYGALIASLVTYGSLRRVVVMVAIVVLAGRLCYEVRDNTVRVDILDVGRGNAALIDVPGSGDVLLDAGPRIFGRDVAQYLRKRGVSHLESLILTHGDADHIGGAFDVLKNISVSELWGSPFLSSSTLYRKLLREAAKRDIRIRRLEWGDLGVLGGGVEWEVLSPSGDSVCRRAAEGSLVIRIARGAASVLFMGGADCAVEAAMLRGAVEPTADILVVGNHGAAGTCSESFLSAVDSSSAIISVGMDNTEGQPDRGVLSRLADRKMTVWRTDESGSLLITFASETERGMPCKVSAISLNSSR